MGNQVDRDQGAVSDVKIFDCFTFFNEFECLEMRLGELGEVVDGFVLVEAPVTHSGKPKSLYYKERYTNSDYWHPKLMPVESDLVYPVPAGEFDPNWQREHAQRNAIMEGLKRFGAADDDIAIIGDADEILARGSVERLHIRPMPCTFRPTTSYYYVNLIYDTDLVCPMAAKVGWLRARAPQSLRGPNRYDLPVVKDVAWHFSYLGGLERIKTKIQAFAHQEFNTPGVLESMQKCIDDRVSYHDRTPLRPVPLNPDMMPRGFNPTKHAHLVLNGS